MRAGEGRHLVAEARTTHHRLLDQTSEEYIKKLIVAVDGVSIKWRVGGNWSISEVNSQYHEMMRRHAMFVSINY